MSNCAPDPTALLMQPLTELHARTGRPLPPGRAVNPEQIPQPYRSLLVHERDMTRTLEQFHGRPIHLEVLSRLHDGGDHYWREVILRLDGTNQPVELGAIRIHLGHFPEPWRTRVLEERIPLGAILNSSGMAYTSRPTSWLEFECDDFVQRVFHLNSKPRLYGRSNVLRDPEGRVLAEIVEILPP